MHVFSYTAEGDLFLLLFILYWSFGRKDCYFYINFVMCTALFSMGMMYIGKSFFHQSRPYFIDFELADKTINESCSAEFGSPSGHSVGCSGPFTGVVSYFVFIRNKEYYRKNVMEKWMIYFASVAYMVLVTYSRVYTGRHSFDQIISGVATGSLGTHFATFYFYPHFYMHFMDKSQRHNYWVYCKWAVTYFVSLMLISLMVFEYVENYVEIPEEWYD
jgi:membrane-associated phospholipid phosphatase